MKDCHTCQRKFERLEEYPLIELLEVKISQIPQDQQFPEYWGRVMWDEKIPFVPESEIPEKVIAQFQRDDYQFVVESDGSIYYSSFWFPGEHTGQRKYKIGKGNDQRELILSHIEPYLNDLQDLTGTISKTSNIFPQFKRNKEGGFIVPNSDYYLSLEEKRRTKSGRKCELIISEYEPEDYEDSYGDENVRFIRYWTKIAELRYNGHVLEKK